MKLSWIEFSTRLIGNISTNMDIDLSGRTFCENHSEQNSCLKLLLCLASYCRVYGLTFWLQKLQNWLNANRSLLKKLLTLHSVRLRNEWTEHEKLQEICKYIEKPFTLINVVCELWSLLFTQRTVGKCWVTRRLHSQSKLYIILINTSNININLYWQERTWAK